MWGIVAILKTAHQKSRYIFLPLPQKEGNIYGAIWFLFGSWPCRPKSNCKMQKAGLWKFMLLKMYAASWSQLPIDMRVPSAQELAGGESYRVCPLLLERPCKWRSINCSVTFLNWNAIRKLLSDTVTS